jgi:hypothetical protein
MSQAPNRVMVVARLRAQLLAGRRAATVADVVRHILAVQAQDDRGARLAIRSRSAGLTASDVDGALSDDRSVVVSWLNRGTLHLVATDDYWWLHALTTPQLRTGNGRRLRQEGVTPKDAARGIDVVAHAVSTDPRRGRSCDTASTTRASRPRVRPSCTSSSPRPSKGASYGAR